MFRWFKTKLFITLGFTHVAFFFSLWGLYKVHAVHGVTQHPAHMQYFPWLFFGAFLTYGAVMGGLVWMYLPFAPWVRRMSSWRAFKNWIVDELPAFIAVASSLAALWPVLRAAWRELKHAQENGKLDFKRFSHVARRVAEKAEHLVSDHDDDHHEKSEKPVSNGRRVA
jgi:hypothetical protein